MLRVSGLQIEKAFFKSEICNLKSEISESTHLILRRTQDHGQRPPHLLLAEVGIAAELLWLGFLLTRHQEACDLGTLALFQVSIQKPTNQKIDNLVGINKSG